MGEAYEAYETLCHHSCRNLCAPLNLCPEILQSSTGFASLHSVQYACLYCCKVCSRHAECVLEHLRSAVHHLRSHAPEMPGKQYQR